LPDEVKHLLDIVQIKDLCRRAGVAEVDAGPRGARIAFRDDSFANPEGLVGLITEDPGRMRLQPDHKLVVKADWDTPERRLQGTRSVMRELAELADSGRKAA